MDRDTVRPVLMNPRNAGLRGYGPKLENGSRRVEMMGPAKWDAIVSEETWRAAVGLLRDPGRFTGRGRGARALLTGIAVCGICEATVHGGGANRRRSDLSVLGFVGSCRRRGARRGVGLRS